MVAETFEKIINLSNLTLFICQFNSFLRNIFHIHKQIPLKCVLQKKKKKFASNFRVEIELAKKKKLN